MSVGSTGVVALKKALRKSVAATLAELPDAAVQRGSEQLAERLAQLPELAAAQKVSLYLSMPKGEAQTGPVLSSLFAARKRVFVPKVVGKSSSDMRMPELRSVAELQSLTLSPWGIPEFTAQQLEERADGLLSDEALVDVVLAPGVAFTERCERLGHGKGYYDSFLTALQRRRAALGLPPAFCVGLCLDEQVQPSVPLSEHDVLLDAVVTPTRLFVRR